MVIQYNTKVTLRESHVYHNNHPRDNIIMNSNISMQIVLPILYNSFYIVYYNVF